MVLSLLGYAQRVLDEAVLVRGLLAASVPRILHRRRFAVGLRRILFIGDNAVEYMQEVVSADDCAILGILHGCADSQQVCEASAMLIALRVWRDKWNHWRSSFSVRGDNVAMLTLLLHFKGSGAALNLIAREVALEIAAASYRPVIAEHIPGASNVLSDALSRAQMPGKVYPLPAVSAGVPRALVPARPRTWYRTLGSPSGPPSA